MVVSPFIVAGLVHLQARFQQVLARRSSASGQATAEYALVLLGAAAIALMLTAWAAKSGAIGKLFDAVVGQLIDDVG